MENATKQRNVRLLTLTGLGAVVVLACLAIGLFACHRPITTVALEPYVFVGYDAAGNPIAEIDSDALLLALHLPSPKDDPRATERYPDVRAILDMRVALSYTEDPESMEITVEADTDTLRQYGIALETLTWQAPIKGRLVVSDDAPSPTPFLPVPAATPTPPPSSDAYLTSLVDAEGNGYNLRLVCERVQKERDDICREQLGDTYKFEKIAVTFSASRGSAPYANSYQACYRAYVENEDPLLTVTLYFRVRLFNLKQESDGTVSFHPHVAVTIHPTESDCKRVPSETEYTTTTLSGGGVRVRSKAAFDQNGFVLFPGQPTSYRMANGLYWSPTYDPLPEELIWKLTAVDGHSLANLLRYARKEIYARYYTSFDPKSEREFYEHYSSYPWYVPMSPDRTVDMTETERANIRLLREIQSLVEK